MLMAKYIDIQNEIIKKYRIDICDGTKCENDWSRTHAHIRERRVCKWKQTNSFASLFTLLHEVGHICNNHYPNLRRAESEYYATVWALDRLKELGIRCPDKTLYEYQRYIEVERARGMRRGGKGYDELSLYEYVGIPKDLDDVRIQARKEGWYV